ncbi:2TM domain-containing protein [Elizabethkingia anophelis]|uniref:2TM domain-containing protein n=1 Tax=Elizabethkingia anophelis TaxID=1117645 RepID=UPI0012B3BE0B|nr:2TM domain-containing protein [Elizabethkingia anophelis]EJC8059634.1 2TM domain-containing protein [Elizabethkingia anophelis]MCL1642091.1 2TM domain-containing protein [Elizabethkingia anophelis]MCL1644637.1 2TM domain-containing protein [Elizabethkingia anophelis]MCT3925906.1 2TM domain-containing protein [Elizabethkingia anophelis]MCT4031969.1 2TM domain-containing protein [Elizabethkingia anophelis]
MKSYLNNDSESISDEEIEFLEAQRRVKEIRGFYIHFLIYLTVNIFILISNFYEYHQIGWTNIYVPVLWGIVILIHAGSVFLPGIIFGSNWEKKKIKKLMEKYKSQNKYD